MDSGSKEDLRLLEFERCQAQASVNHLKKCPTNDISACESSFETLLPRCPSDVGSNEQAWWSEYLDVKIKTMEEALERRLREHVSLEQRSRHSVNKDLDLKIKTMEETIEKRLRAHFSLDEKSRFVGSKDIKDARDALDGHLRQFRETLDSQLEDQVKLNRKIAALENSCVELGRKLRKHHNAFIDVRSNSVMLKEILCGIIRLVDSLGVAAEPHMKNHNRLTARVTSMEKCLIDAGTLLDEEDVWRGSGSPRFQSAISTVLPAADFTRTCTDLADLVNRMSREGLWLDSREGADTIDTDAIYKDDMSQLGLPEQTSPALQQLRRDINHQTKVSPVSGVEGHSVASAPQSPVDFDMCRQQLQPSSPSEEVFVLQSSSSVSSLQAPAYHNAVGSRHVAIPALPLWARNGAETHILTVDDVGKRTIHSSGSYPTLIGGTLASGSLSAVAGAGVSQSPLKARVLGSSAIIQAVSPRSTTSRSLSPNGQLTDPSRVSSNVTPAQLHSPRTSWPVKTRTCVGQASQLSPVLGIRTPRARSPTNV